MKLLIADDDEQIRSGMEEGIDWAALDIKQVVTASNGLEALQRFTELMPEIVVTDVRMPGMDGLELLKRIKEIRPETRVVILSGYNDFEYLKKAIQLDAVDYEMKPIRVRNLIALIQQIKEDIIRERATEQEFHKYLASYKANFADEMLTGSLTDRLVILEGLQQYFGFDASESLICITVELDGNWKSDSALTKSATDAVLRLFQSGDLAERGICLSSKGGKMVFLVQAKTNSFLYYTQFANEVAGLLRDWNRETKSVCRSSFSAGISSPGSAAEFERLHREANLALSRRVYAGLSSVHIYDSSTTIHDKAIVGLLDNSGFFSQLSRGELAAAALTVSHEFDRIKQEHMYARKSLSSYSCSLLQMLKVTARNIPSDVIERIQERIEFIEVHEEFLLFDEFRESVVSVFEETAARLSKGLSPLMIRADEFIRKSFTSELTVETLAEYVGKTPNYFSHLFKREFGISFKEYINRLRIAKAKELILSTNDLIYEISEQVGFSDYTYFTQVFKKLEGYSPAVLRKQRQD
ncbi:response regulator [Paenibacillus sp. N4]|uniref:response regulator transcription factor n=1 Tax=Paenibacillus vietnamensis TaxID=2590547 RepID=UPI001CD0EC3A|nr:response regulator [Paenibacillus vietnamensis]MCA0755819.1 response regulator [Paenibacillus vietnamensis]